MTRIIKALGLALLLAIFGTAAFATQTLVVDPNHSSVSFQIRHFVSKVRGEFTAFSGTVAFDEAKPENSTIDLVIDAKSINTRNERRDGDLRSPNFFDVEKYPTITFKSKRLSRTGENGFTVVGDLTMHGVTKEITAQATSLGKTKDSRGNLKGGFEGSATIKRGDFGITWNTPADNGLMLGDDVEVEVTLEVTEQPKQTSR